MRLRRGWASMTTTLVLISALGACSSGSSGWVSVSESSFGAGTVRLVHAAAWSGGLVGVGSVTAGDNRVPALWRTTDGRSWSRLDTVPKSFYGFVSELTTVAVKADGAVAAIGQAVGGAHGNPRVGSWYLDGSTLVEVPAEVELYGGPRQGSVNEMAAGPTAFVVVGTRTDRNERTGAAAWVSPDARSEFTIVDTDPALESAPGETARALGVAANATGYLAVGDRFVSGTGRVDADGLFWSSPDGTHWTRVGMADPSLLAGPGTEEPQLATAWRGGWAVAGTNSVDGRTTVVVWTSPDGTSWQWSDVGALGSDPDSLSAVTSLQVVGSSTLVVGARLGTRLVVATSIDGRAWKALSLPPGMPSSEHGVVVAAPARDRLVLAATGDASTHVWSTPASAVT
jgi:hypothetical protein